MAQLDIGELRARLGLDTTGLTTGAARAEKTFQRLDRVQSALTGKIVAYGAAIVAVAAPAILIKSSLNAIDAQESFAFRLASSVKELQTLQHAANLAGISFEELSKAGDMLNRRLAEAARTGEGDTASALRRIGLSARDLLALPVNERLAAIGNAMVKAGLSTAQMTEAVRNLGIRGAQLVELLGTGGQAIRDAAKDVKDFGVVVSGVNAQKIVQANDAWSTTALILQGVGNQLAVRVAPFLLATATALQDSARGAEGWGASMDSAMQKIIAGVGEVQRLQMLALQTVGPWKEAFTSAMDEMRKKVEAMFPVLVKFRDYLIEIAGKGINKIAEAWGKAKAAIETPPEVAPFERAMGLILLRSGMLAAEQDRIREDQKKKRQADADALSVEQRRALENQFVQLQRSVANEAAALDFARQEELKKLQEFEAKKVGTAQERAAVRAAIETKFQRDLSDLRFTKLEQDVATEQEVLLRQHEDKLRAISEFEAARGLIEGEAGELRRKHAEKLSRDLMQIQAAQYSALASIVDQSMSQIQQVVGKEGGAAFNIMKGISMATALVKGYEAVVSAFAAGNKVGGPPLGFAFAAIAAAGVAAQIAALAAVQPGSGTAAGPTVTPGAGAGGAAAATAPNAWPGGWSNLDRQRDQPQRAFLQGVGPGVGRPNRPAPT